MKVSLSRIVAGTLAMSLLAPAPMLARDGSLAAWQNLRQLAAGQEIEVATKGRTVKGTFVAFADESISLRQKQQETAIPRADVSQVRLRPARRGRYTLIGAAVGAGAGAGVGAGLAEGLSNESGWDFRNLKPAVIGLSAVFGALVGLVVGSALGGRHTTIYRAR
jgi:hypothetical protein